MCVMFWCVVLPVFVFTWFVCVHVCCRFCHVFLRLHVCVTCVLFVCVVLFVYCFYTRCCLNVFVVVCLVIV